MPKYKLEYIWLDGKKPIPELRGKTNIKEFDKAPTLADMPLWGFDGSSTMQAAGNKSDCILKPVALYPDAGRKDGFIVLSEVMLPDGTPLKLPDGEYFYEDYLENSGTSADNRKPIFVRTKMTIDADRARFDFEEVSPERSGVGNADFSQTWCGTYTVLETVLVDEEGSTSGGATRSPLEGGLECGTVLSCATTNSATTKPASITKALRNIGNLPH